MPIGIGYELNVMGWCKNRDVLNCECKMVELLSKICSAVGMRELLRNSVTVEPDLSNLGGDVFNDEGGVTAVLVLSTSHIAVHGWPLRDTNREDGGYFWFNICSCRDFNPIIVEDILKATLDTTVCNSIFKEYCTPVGILIP